MEKRVRGLLLCLIVTIMLVVPVFAQTYAKPISKEIVLEGELMSEKPSGMGTSKIYETYSPAVVKIFSYVDYKVYLPDYEVEYDPYTDEYYAAFKKGAKNYLEILEEDLEEEEKVLSSYGGEYSSGSGFLISSDGYILTNAHVAALNKEDLKEEIRDLYYWMFYDNAEELYASGELTYDEYYWEWVLSNHVYDNAEVTVSNIRYEVIVGVDGVGKGAKKYIPTLLVSEGGNWIDWGTPEFNTVKDWALLKIEGKNLPYVNGGDSYSPGEDLIIIGYPGVTEAQDVYSEDLGSYRTDIRPTITKGIITSIKQDGNDKVIQTDASISGGNSGGPVFNKNGEVIGIAAYGFSEYQGGNYNYAVRISDVEPKISQYVSLSRLQYTDSNSNLFYFMFGLIIVILLIGIVIGIVVKKQSKNEKARTSRKRKKKK